MNSTTHQELTRPATDPTAGSIAGPGGVRATRAVVTLTSAVIAVCAFTFSFGNIWRLALTWGVPGPIAPLVAPMLDVSVVGLLIAIRELSLHGVPGRALTGARLLMLVCAVTTWGLNIAQPVLDHRWGGVVIDSVAPALLLGWAEVGPTLLRLTAAFTTPATSAPQGLGGSYGVNIADPAMTGVATRRGTAAATATGGHTPVAAVPPSHGVVGTVAAPARAPGATGGDGDGTRSWSGRRTASGTAWDRPDEEGDLPHVA
jgi:Protein of unknown function (DUF2637)